LGVGSSAKRNEVAGARWPSATALIAEAS
jgi:hypothetical protein